MTCKTTTRYLPPLQIACVVVGWSMFSRFWFGLASIRKRIIVSIGMDQGFAIVELYLKYLNILKCKATIGVVRILFSVEAGKRYEHC